jgi:hypothetical protein
VAGGDQRPDEEVGSDPWDRFSELLGAQFAKLEKRIEQHDEMLANIMGGYAQLWAGLEALLTVILEDRPPEDREKWETALRFYSSELWKAVQSGATEMAGGATPNS